MSDPEQKSKEIKKNLLDIENEVEANPQIKLLIEIIARIFLLSSLVAISIFIGLLLQGYLTNHIAYEDLIFDVFNIKYGIHEFNYYCFGVIGCLLFASIPFLSVNNNLKFKKTKYILFISGITFLFLHIILLIQTRYRSINSWEYFTQITLIFCLIPMTFSSLSKNHEYLFKAFSLIAITVAIFSIIMN
jgi:hypothetical protein